MYTFSVFKDIETPRHAGVDGFQIIEIRDYDDQDITSQFDQGKIYQDNEDLAKDISKKLGLPLDLIEIIEE